MSNHDTLHTAAAPVTFLTDDEATGKSLKDGMALCLSGGGYRAMLFHAGALLRINEAGLLGALKRISSVSGGSITAATLGMNWNSLDFDGGIAQNLEEALVKPIRAMGAKTIDRRSILGGLGLPGSIGEWIASAYDKHLFKGATLQDLPTDDEGPRFVINATNIQSGALWRFSRPYMADYKVGRVLDPDVPLADAVAASSAFPPVLSPFKLELDHDDFEVDGQCPLQMPPYTTDVYLSDGGVYDNLGLETAWKRYKTILVSDAGGKMQPEAEPDRDWARHAIRVLNVIDNQVRSLRKRQIMGAFANKKDLHSGAFWSTWSDIKNYGLDDALDCPAESTEKLAKVKTRLRRMSDVTMNRLVNWGYAVCDAALRKHVLTSSIPAPAFPYPGGVG
jgi:NTE family protein